jgi:hypothetical protein
VNDIIGLGPHWFGALPLFCLAQCDDLGAKTFNVSCLTASGSSNIKPLLAVERLSVASVV